MTTCAEASPDPWLQDKGNDWWFVALAYGLLVIPLGMYIFHDVIDSRWRPQHRNMWWYRLYLVLNILLYPLALIYFVAQVMDKDYKEACAVVVPLVLNFYAALKVFRGLSIMGMLCALGRRLHLTDDCKRPHPYVGDLSQSVCSKLMDDDYPGDAPRFRWGPLWRMANFSWSSEDFIVHASGVIVDAKEFVLIVVMWACRCLCQDASPEESRQLHVQLYKEQQCWLMRSLDRATVVGFMVAQGDILLRAGDARFDLPADAGLRPYDPSSATHAYKQSELYLRTGSTSTPDMSLWFRAGSELSIKVALLWQINCRLLGEEMERQPNTARVRRLFTRIAARSLLTNLAYHRGIQTWARRLTDIMRHLQPLFQWCGCAADAATLRESAVQVQRPADFTLRVHQLSEAAGHENRHRGQSTREQHAQWFLRPVDWLRKKQKECQAFYEWQKRQMALQMTVLTSEQLRQRHVQDGPRQPGLRAGGIRNANLRLVVPHALAAYTTSLLPVLCAAADTSQAEQTQRLSELPPDDLDHTVGCLCLAVVGLVDFHNRLATLPIPSSIQHHAASNARHHNNPYRWQPIPGAVDGVHGLGSGADACSQIHPQAALHRACAALLGIADQLMLPRIPTADREVPFDAPWERLQDSLEPAERAVLDVFLEPFKEKWFELSWDAGDQLTAGIISHCMPPPRIQEADILGFMLASVQRKPQAEENTLQTGEIGQSGTLRRIPLLMAISFAGVICSGHAMALHGADDLKPLPKAQHDIMLLAALHHAVCCGWEAFLGLPSRGWLHAQRSAELKRQAVEHGVLQKWGITCKRSRLLPEHMLQQRMETMPMDGRVSDKHAPLQNAFAKPLSISNDLQEGLKPLAETVKCNAEANRRAEVAELSRRAATSEDASTLGASRSPDTQEHPNESTGPMSAGSSTLAGVQNGEGHRTWEVRIRIPQSPRHRVHAPIHFQHEHNGLQPQAPVLSSPRDGQQPEVPWGAETADETVMLPPAAVAKHMSSELEGDNAAADVQERYAAQGFFIGRLLMQLFELLSSSWLDQVTSAVNKL